MGINEEKINDSRFVTISDMSYSDFVELLAFLKRNSKEESDEDKILDALDKLKYFFFKNGNVEDIMIKGVATEILSGKEALAKFTAIKEMYPDITVDRWGRSLPEEKTYGGIRIGLLDELYEKAESDLKKAEFCDKSPNKVNTQVYNGKTLECFKNHQNTASFEVLRAMFMKKTNTRIQVGEIDALNDYLNKLVGDNSVLLYMLADNMKVKNDNRYYTLFQHVLARCEVAYKEKLNKGEPYSVSSVLFLDKLKQVSK